MIDRPGGRLDRLAVGLVALPVLILAMVTATVSQAPWGDQAVILLSTDRAASLRQLVGPYSRFGWSHPGPLYFYLLALPYKLLGSTERGLAVGSVLLAGLFAVATVAATGALAGPRAARWAAALSLLELAALGPSTVAQVWNPVAIIVPTGTYLVCAAALARGRRWGLPACVTLGSFLVQTDVGTGVLVAGVGGLALAAGAWAVRDAGGRTGRLAGAGWHPVPRTGAPIDDAFGAGAGWLPVLLGSAILGLVLWLPPLVQEATGHPGNLTELVKFFTSSPPHQGIAHAVQAIGGALWPPLRGRLDAAPPGLAAAAAVLAVFLSSVGVVISMARRRGRPDAAGLAALAGLGVLAGVVSADRVIGPLLSYLTNWSSAAVLVLALALALSLVPDRGAGPEWAGAAVGVAAGLALVAASFVVPPAGSVQGAQVDALWSRLRPQLPAGEPVRLRLASADRWPWQAGLMVDLTHAGHPVTVDPSWVFLFGSQFAGAAPAGAALVVLWSPGSAGPAPAGRPVARVPGTWVYLSPARRSGSAPYQSKTPLTPSSTLVQGTQPRWMEALAGSRQFRASSPGRAGAF